MDNNKESQRLMWVKQQLVMTTNTPGWQCILQIAENVIQDAERKAIDEEDEARGSMLRRQAQALRKGLNVIFTTIETSKQIDLDPTEPDWFSELGTGWEPTQEIEN